MSLMNLCKTGTLEEVKQILKTQPITTINDLDENGENCLFYAYNGKRYDILLFLINLNISNVYHKNNSDEPFGIGEANEEIRSIFHNYYPLKRIEYSYDI